MTELRGLGGCMDAFFRMRERGTSVRVEGLAGLATFLTMSYIVFINPQLLAQTGMDQGAVFTATCLAAALGSFLMGLLADFPIALAPGMSLNTYFTYGVVIASGFSWQTALGIVFLSGCLFLILSLSRIREYIIQSIPRSLKLAIVAGVGFFLGAIGLKSAGILNLNASNYLVLGDWFHAKSLLALIGFILILILDYFRIIGSIIISILLISLLGYFLGYNTFNGLFALPPTISPVFLKLDFLDAINLSTLPIIFAFLLVEFFDNTGTLLGVAHRAGLMDKQGNLPGIQRALIADSISAILSAILGTSTTSSYLESTVGVKSGGRTGLTAMVTGTLFLAALFFAPLATAIPAYATAPALIYIAFLMARALVEIEWKDFSEYLPAIVTVIMMPITFSIASGIGCGLIAYTLTKCVTRRFSELNLTIIILSAIFILKFIVNALSLF